ASAKDYLTRIRTAAQRMGQLINDLLKLSRMGRGEITRQSVDLSSLAKSIVVEMRESEPTRAVEFVAEAEVEAQGDPRLLRIALDNLLRNAWKFTQKKPQCRIEFGKRVEHEESVFFVSDNGVGFDPTYANKLFQPFQRLHTSSEFEGTGIGLAIVNRI